MRGFLEETGKLKADDKSGRKDRVVRRPFEDRIPKLTEVSVGSDVTKGITTETGKVALWCRSLFTGHVSKSKRKIMLMWRHGLLICGI
jgi:hypothetical protein